MIKYDLVFVKSSLKDLKQFPEGAIRSIGYNLSMVQEGKIPNDAKKLKGMNGVYELVERYNKDTYRAVYYINFGSTVYVLHCFKKKSKTGIKTPQSDIELIKQRLKTITES